MKRRFVLLAVSLLLASACSLSAATFNVANADDIETAMETAQPGDTLIMADGNWTSQEIDFAGVGTSGNPITLRAETPGGVILNGLSRLRISGDHLVVDGLHFKDGTIENSDHVVQFRGPLGEATNSRFTNSVIESYSGPDLNDKYHYVSLYGQNNRIDNNRFLDQQNIGPQIVAWLDESANPISAFHRIDSNHFGDRPRGWANGFEAIRLGDSDTSGVDAHIVVENNLFERVDGEIEIISSKSNFNVFRNNTFRESKGTLTLRHGNGNTVEGNFFLGEGAEDSGGIRVVGQDHTIVNNYIANVDDEADGAISFAAGIPNTQLNGYLQVKNTVVAHNTIVDVEGAGVTFDWGIGSSGRSLLPESLTFNGNLISGSAGPVFEGTEGVGYSFADNIAHGAPVGISSRPGILEVDPQLAQDADGIWRPSGTSPAVDGAATSPLFTVDMDGQARSGLYDIGADEVSAAPILSGPLTTDDVGALWFNYQAPSQWPLPLQLPPGEFLVIEAEGYSSVTDPDADGNEWMVVNDTDASDGAAIEAPSGSRTDLPGIHETLAVYDLVFDEAGDYTAYYLARGFAGSSDSFFTPAGFGVDPASTENISSNGVFRWENGDEFTLSQANVGVPVEFRLGRREGGAQIDALIFHENSSLSAAQLDAILASVSDPNLNCDLNADGQCDLVDIELLVDDVVLGSATSADIDTWLADASDPANPYLNGARTFVIGDVNLDGAVNSADLGLMLNNFSSTSAIDWVNGNMNGDGVVNSADLGLLLNNFTFASASAVPEPATSFMSLLAIAGFVVSRKRRRAA